MDKIKKVADLFDCGQFIWTVLIEVVRLVCYTWDTLIWDCIVIIFFLPNSYFEDKRALIRHWVWRYMFAMDEKSVEKIVVEFL